MKKIARGYTLNECPPVGEAIPLSIQQIVVLIFNVLPVPLLIGGGIGLNAAEITILVAGCLLVTGIATILQTIGAGPIGAKLPIPLESSTWYCVWNAIWFGRLYGRLPYWQHCYPVPMDGVP